MNFIQLSAETAPAARAAIPPWPPLPEAQLSRGLTAAALAALNSRAHALVDAPSTAARAHCADIAAFADRVCAVDAETAAALRDAGPEVG